MSSKCPWRSLTHEPQSLVAPEEHHCQPGGMPTGCSCAQYSRPPSSDSYQPHWVQVFCPGLHEILRRDGIPLQHFVLENATHNNLQSAPQPTEAARADADWAHMSDPYMPTMHEMPLSSSALQTQPLSSALISHIYLMGCHISAVAWKESELLAAQILTICMTATTSSIHSLPGKSTGCVHRLHFTDQVHSTSIDAHNKTVFLFRL